MSTLQPGQLAPEFELPDQTGQPVALSSFKGRSPVVLFFYPKDDTTGCTIEACGFRDSLPQFSAKGAKVIGISSDSPDSHDRFVRKYGLPFTLLSDRKGAVRKLYGATGLFGLIPGRVTYVIDREGIIRHVFSSQTQFQQHVAQALASLG